MRTAPDALGFFVGDYEGLTSVPRAFVPVFVTANNGNIANPTDVFSASVAPELRRHERGPSPRPCTGERPQAAGAPDQARRGDHGPSQDPLYLEAAGRSATRGLLTAEMRSGRPRGGCERRHETILFRARQCPSSPSPDNSLNVRLAVRLMCCRESSGLPPPRISCRPAPPRRQRSRRSRIATATGRPG